MNDWLDRDVTCDEAPWVTLSDDEADHLARLELAQRMLWAAEMGVDPLRGDLFGLRPVAPTSVRRAA
jgi:hypothetical protein